jgi:hypothetical protein
MDLDRFRRAKKHDTSTRTVGVKKGGIKMTIGVVSIGMLLLALWLILTGLSSLVSLPIPSRITGVLALLAGILLLIGR